MNNLLPVALMGTGFALYDFFSSKQRKLEIAEAVKEAGTMDGGEQNVGI